MQASSALCGRVLPAKPQLVLHGLIGRDGILRWSRSMASLRSRCNVLNRSCDGSLEIQIARERRSLSRFRLIASLTGFFSISFRLQSTQDRSVLAVIEPVAHRFHDQKAHEQRQ
jgi:hypothetical protein